MSDEKALVPKVPNKLTPEKHQAIINNMKLGCTLEVAAGAAFVSDRCLDYWLQAGRKELQEDENADGPCARLVRDQRFAEREFEKNTLGMIQSHAPKNWVAGAWLLERKFPERYAKVDRVRVSGDETNDKPVQISDEERQNRLLDKLASIAEKALDRAGKEDDPVVIEGHAEVIDQ